MREKLIELLMTTPTDYEGNRGVGVIADYLLANGVIVLPCKVGDTVYVISRRDIVPLKVDSIMNNNRGINILGRNEKYWGNGTITLRPDKRIVDWYLTREEAEKALEEMKNE